VTVVAVLLTCRIKIRSLEWAYDFPLMSLSDPTHALFLYAEHERREVQSGLVSPWLSARGKCSACMETSLDRSWQDLLDEAHRYRNDGYRRHGGAKWRHEAEAARAVSLAGWGDEQRILRLHELNTDGLPDYLTERIDEIVRGDVDAERERARSVGLEVVLSAGVHFGVMLFAVFTLVEWRRGYRYPRRHARSQLASPALGRGLLIFVWAQGFVSVLTRLQWDNPDSPFEILNAIPSLSLAIAITLLIVGTRLQRADRPIKDLLRCPPDRRSRRAMWVLAFASVGIVYAFNWLDWRALHWLLASTWSDGVRERIIYGSSVEAALARFSAVVVAPFAEELAYRGVLFGSLATRMSIHHAALISCAVFAAVHGYDWYGFASVALSGYLWARLAARTGSLVPGMIAHGVFNLIWSFGMFAWRT
jgi:membrane protease YdiL (CAAX protease family)